MPPDDQATGAGRQGHGFPLTTVCAIPAMNRALSQTSASPRKKPGFSARGVKVCVDPGVKRFCEPAKTGPGASDPIERDRIGIWIVDPLKVARRTPPPILNQHLHFGIGQVELGALYAGGVEDNCAVPIVFM